MFLTARARLRHLLLVPSPRLKEALWFFPVCSSKNCNKPCGLRNQEAAWNVEGKWLCQTHYERYLQKLREEESDLITRKEIDYDTP
jgi:hypothetical protein